MGEGKDCEMLGKRTNHTTKKGGIRTHMHCSHKDQA